MASHDVRSQPPPEERSTNPSAPGDERTPDLRSPARFLLWLARRQSGTLAWGVFWGCVWMVSMALTPYAVGRALDQIVRESRSGLWLWTGVVLALAVATAVGSLVRHRCDTFNRLGTVHRTARLVAAKTVSLGDTLHQRVARGQLVAVGTSDLTRLGAALGVAARGVGGAVSIVLVAAVLLTVSWPLALMILIGVPLLLAGTGPLLAPLHNRMGKRRELQAELAGRANDIVTGLPVLRGVGGERLFAGRYRAHSQRVRKAGVEVARIDSMLVAAEILLPGVFVVAVLWVSAHLAVGGSISPGDLVAFYGYAAFLVLPMRMVTATFTEVTGALVAARHVVALLALLPRPDAEPPAGPFPARATLVDPSTGLVVRPGTLTAVVPETPEQGVELADRIGRYRDGEVTADGVPLARYPEARLRAHVLVADNDAHLFSGPLADTVRAGSPEAADAALRDAVAEDIVEALPEGRDGELIERGLNLSGGQRQRLRLARAFAHDPDVLVLVEPTSAVDAHTEATIADRLRAARTGRTTVVITTSPLVLARADEVAYLRGGTVVATGDHRELLGTDPHYTATVLREES
ncbi:ABC transporter ATP-binding protein [Streptomyces sp. NBRC 109706]|uniref:ABC transporter ATP-binding protein n=1 Tax=Streptomyces sp. NBRC 109706 TaxID=1550035 RepID=UPI00099E0CA4|nr:ABC transporter ATP-binding protein [Streptomyces sp. NBRC 109706]